MDLKMAGSRGRRMGGTEEEKDGEEETSALVRRIRARSSS